MKTNTIPVRILYMTEQNIRQRIEALHGERRAEAARLRAQGLSLRQIGERLGYSAPQVREWLIALAAEDPDDNGAAGAEKLAPSVGGYSTDEFLKAVPRS
jgi:ParB-like chromosome segregation protein Spo0J